MIVLIKNSIFQFKMSERNIFNQKFEYIHTVFKEKILTDIIFLLFRFLTGFNGFNDWKRKKKKAPQLTTETLKFYSSALFRYMYSLI